MSIPSIPSGRAQVSGPPESVERFVAELAADGVFARRVNSSGVAFHSQYIAAAAPQLRASLLQVIPQPKPRSARWLSSSLPREQWGSELGECGAVRARPPPRGCGWGRRMTPDPDARVLQRG